MVTTALLAGTLALPLAGRLLRPALGFIRRRPAVSAGIAGTAGLAAFGGQQALTIGGDGLRPRRRRRRALTADDMRTALTIASAISKKAAENFILQRTRR